MRFILRQLNRTATLTATLLLMLSSFAFAANWAETANSRHSFKELGPDFYVDVPMAPVEGARLLLFNKDAAKRLGLEIPDDPAALEKIILKNFALFVNPEHPTTHMMATYYMDSGKKGPGEALGDGRAVWTGETKFGGTGVDFVLKGIGVTPLAWTNHSEIGHKDGLQSMTEAIHSFIHSEANFRNGLDSTVDLAVIELPQQKMNKYTGKTENATITLRAGDQLRVAHLAYHSDNTENFKKIFNYAMAREFGVQGNINEYFQKFSINLGEEAARQFDLHAVHGSPTLGNRTLRGSTIDMGTFRYLDANHGQYSYLFNRLKHEDQKAQMKAYIDYLLQAANLANVITNGQRIQIAANSYQTFEQTFRDTLKDVWLSRLGLNDAQITTLDSELKNKFYKATLDLYLDKSDKVVEVAGQKMDHPAYFDVRYIFKNILANISGNEDSWKLLEANREWQTSQPHLRRFIPRLGAEDASHIDKLQKFRALTKEIVTSLNLSNVEWRQLYSRNTIANQSRREIPVDEIFFQKEKLIAAMIENKKSYVEISNAALRSIDELVDAVPERRSQPEGYKLMNGSQQISIVRCEKLFAL